MSKSRKHGGTRCLKNSRNSPVKLHFAKSPMLRKPSTSSISVKPLVMADRKAMMVAAMVKTATIVVMMETLAMKTRPLKRTSLSRPKRKSRPQICQTPCGKWPYLIYWNSILKPQIFSTDYKNGCNRQSNSILLA